METAEQRNVAGSETRESSAAAYKLSSQSTAVDACTTLSFSLGTVSSTNSKLEVFLSQRNLHAKHFASGALFCFQY